MKMPDVSIRFKCVHPENADIFPHLLIAKLNSTPKTPRGRIYSYKVEVTFAIDNFRVFSINRLIIGLVIRVLTVSAAFFRLLCPGVLLHCCFVPGQSENP